MSKYLAQILILFLFSSSIFVGAVENKKLIIAIDPGHTKKHFGAVSARGVLEYEFNIAIAEVLLSKIKETIRPMDLLSILMVEIFCLKKEHR